MLGFPVESPRAPVYVVKNTFVEVVDENDGEQNTEELAMPAFRRRRGSSFFRCSSEPLAAGGRSGQSACREDFPCDVASTEDEWSEGISTPDMSPATSRAASPAPGACSPMYARFGQLPKLEPSGQGALTAAMHAGFNAGVLTAMAMKEQHCMLVNAAFCPQRTRLRQTPLLFETHPSSGPRQAAETSPFDQTSDAGTVVSGAKQSCHFIWCDHRAFKESSGALKDQLESRSGASVKTHKTAENCIRLFRKKQRAQGRPPCVVLVSWANAPALLSYLAEGQHVAAKVVVLCDARSCRKNESAEELAVQFPFIEKITITWEEAVESACNAVAAFK